MDTRTKTEVVEFRHPFLISTRSGLMPAGHYQIEIEEEMLFGLSYPTWRRTRMTITRHGLASGRMPQGIPITSAELIAALAADEQVPS